MSAAKKQLLVSLEDLACQLGIKLRYEKTSARGGLCRHNGRYLIIIDKKASEDLKIDLLAGSLKTFDLSGMFMPPKLRDFLEL